MPIDARTLYDIARAALRPMELGRHGEAGQVACALETENGDVFTGICIDLPCGLGFCAEQAAAAQMLKEGTTAIRRIVAVHADDGAIPPCGRCREFLVQLDDANAETLVVLPAAAVPAAGRGCGDKVMGDGAVRDGFAKDGPSEPALREVRLAALLPERWDEEG